MVSYIWNDLLFGFFHCLAFKVKLKQQCGDRIGLLLRTKELGLRGKATLNFWAQRLRVALPVRPYGVSLFPYFSPEDWDQSCPQNIGFEFYFKHSDLQRLNNE
jgi:hypothetical protein